jgi:hypothetical protein
MPIHEFQDNEIGTDVVDLTDVRVVESGDGAGFPSKSFRVLLGRNLESDHPAEAGVASLIDDTHPPSADPRENFVGSERIADR